MAALEFLEIVKKAENGYSSQKEWYITISQFHSLFQTKIEEKDGFRNDIVSLNNPQHSGKYAFVHIITHKGIKFISCSKTMYRWGNGDNKEIDEG